LKGERVGGAEQTPQGHSGDGLQDLPDDWAITDQMRRWAKRDGFSDVIDIDHATAQFVSHYRSTGARRKSWPDAWQKWIRDDAKKAANRRVTGRHQGGSGQTPEERGIF
jgi:hypothetical protein